MSLEALANVITTALFAQGDYSEVEQAKIEYGISLTLGILIELMAAILVAILLGTLGITLVVMLAALSIRLFTGGAHCSSYRRCLVFTLVVFLSVSLVIKHVDMSPVVIWLLMGFPVSVLWVKGKMVFGLLVTGCFVVFALLNMGITLLVAMVAGLCIQGVMLTKLGGRLVNLVDIWLTKIGV